MLKRILITGLLCAGFALAQRGGGGGSKGGGDMAPTMGAAMPNRIDRIAAALNLDKDQKKTVRTILEDGAKEAAPLRDQVAKSRIALGEAIGAQKGEEELKQIARTSSDLSAQLTELELQTFAKVFGTLNDDQKKDSQALVRAYGLIANVYHNKNWNED